MSKLNSSLEKAFLTLSGRVWVDVLAVVVHHLGIQAMSLVLNRDKSVVMLMTLHDKHLLASSVQRRCGGAPDIGKPSGVTERCSSDVLSY